MKQYSTLQNIWRGFWPLLAYFFFPIVIMNLTYWGLRITTDSYNADQLMNQNAILLTGIILSFSLSLWIPLWNKTKKTHVTLNNGKLNIAQVALTVVLFLAGLLLVVVLVGNILTPDDLEAFLSMFTMESLLVRIVVIGFIGAIVEELVFRGVLLNRLSTWMPAWVAVLASSIIFGLIHFNLIQILYAIPMGALLAVAYMRTRNMWIPIIGHIAFNLASVFAIHYVETTGSGWPGLIVAIPAVVLIAGSGLLLWRVSCEVEQA